MSRNNRWFAGVGLLVASVALTAVGAEAVPINFSVDVGGTIQYMGGTIPLVISGAPVSAVDNGIAPPISVTGGFLSLVTGDFTSGTATTSGFQSIYADGGGVFNLFGDVGSGWTTLLSGSFLGPVTFDCCLLGSSSLSGLLTVNSVDANLASLLGFNLPATGGSLGLVQLFETIPTAPGVAFSGLQAGGVITVVDVIPLPPAVFLMGSGLAGLVGLRFCRGKR
ncbi:hypothetical protein [Candidatus Nitrospira inopinata]|jgi:hypothetical protein|nr:hypothetical protein [Candidatus Nitrospira inopinata]